MSTLPIEIVNPIGEVLHLKHAGQTLEFYEIPNTYKELVEFIREKTDLKGDLAISWTRTKNLSSSNSSIHEQINMVDESDWNRCKKHYQLQFQHAPQKNHECIITVRVEIARRRNHYAVQENDQAHSGDLIKQYHQQQSKIENQPQPQSEQEQQEYSNLVSAKEQQTIEYLVQRKLCQLYPELESTITTPSIEQLQKQSKIANQIVDTRSVQWCEKQPVRKLSSLPEQSLSKEESESSKEGNKQMEKSAANLKKKKKKAQLFQELFSGGQASCSEETKVTPGGEEMFLPEEGEICEFDVVKHSEDLTIRTGESKVVTVQIKCKYANWPREPCSLEEIYDQHFEKIHQVVRFQADTEIQTIQIELRPLEKIKGTIISSWKLFFGESVNKKFLSGVIPLKVNVM